MRMEAVLVSAFAGHFLTHSIGFHRTDYRLSPDIFSLVDLDLWLPEDAN